MLRVLLISAAGALGGAERSLYELAAALPRERVEAHVCAPPGALLEACAAAGVPAHPVPLARFRASVNPLKLAAQYGALKRAGAALEALCRAHRFALLHANTDHAALAAWRASRRAGVPFVWHCRDVRRMGRLWRAVAHSAAGVVAISETVAAHLHQQGLMPAKISTIVNGIDLRPFAEVDRARVRAALGLTPEQPVLLSAGAYVPWKRHETFFAALSLARRARPETVGLLAGSDLFGENAPYRNSLRAAAARVDGLRLLGQREDMPNLLAAADVFVSCSHNEPFGRVLAEAGAAGVPVVAVDSGAKAEIVADGVTGFLTAPDAESVASACEELLAAPALRAQFGAAARERVARLFDVRRTAAEITALWEAVAQRAAAVVLPYPCGMG